MQKFPSENISASNKKQTPPEPKKKKQETYEECFFNVEDLNQVIKVPECLYANDNQKVAGTFFVCSCMDDNSPICEGCALKCHSGHTMYELQGSHMCTCGKMNHLVKDISQQNKEGGYPCFYSKFYEITPNKGFEIKDNAKYCSICAAYCNSAFPVGMTSSLTQEMLSMSYLSKSAEMPKLAQDKAQDNVVDEYSYSNLENKQQCTCMDNHMNNVVRLNGDLTRKVGFHTHMRNFNVNILFKIQKTKQLYVKSLTEQIKVFINKKATNQIYEFPGNYLTTSILEMFSNFAANWKNKYVSIVSFLYEFQFDDLLSLMTIPKENHVPESQTPENYFNGKLYFAELLFNYYIKSHVLRYNNLFSMKTILNMSIGQRVNFLHHAKEFYKYIYYRDNDGDNVSAEVVITKLSSAIIELYSTIIKMSSQLEWKVLNKSFTTFNRIMKFLLKYNLIGDIEKKKYFDIVLDTLHLFYRDKKQVLVGTSLHLIKCVLYAGIYINDRKCISYITNTKHGEKFVFQIDDLNIKICKIFLIVFPFINCWFKEDETPQMRFGSAGWYYMKETFLEKNLIYDYCMKKFFSFLIVKDDFYSTSIKRIDAEDKQIIEDFHAHPHDYHEHFFNERLRNMKFYNVLSALSEELGTETKHYIQYEISLEIFVRRVAVLYSNFEMYLEKQKKQDILDKLNEKIRTNLGSQDDNRNYYYSGSNCYNSRDETVDTTRDKEQTYTRQFDINENNIIDNFKTTDYPKIKKEVSKLFKQDLKESIMVTNFIQKIDEFFHIYSKGLEFKDQDYNTSGGKSDLRTIINFIMKLYMKLIKNDLKMLILVTNTKPEIFIPTCLLGDSDILFRLLNRVCDLLVEHKNDLSDDCFYFYIGCLRQMLFLQGENIQLLPSILRLAGKCVRVVMQKDTNYCALIEMFSELFGKLKNITAISRFFDVNNQPSSDIIEFFESYFNFLSELMNNDLYVYDLVKNEIVSLEAVEKCVFRFLNLKGTYESPEFEYALFRYYFLKKLSLGITKKDINYQMRNLFDREINPDYEINLFKLITNPNDGVNANKMKLKEVLNTTKILKQVMKKFICETYNNFILNYYEHILIRPLNVLMNYFVIYSNDITGADCYILYESLFLFYEITLKIFGGERSNYGYNEICVKSHLSEDDIHIVCEEKMKLSSDNVNNENAIRYFELKKLYESFMKVSECVLNVKNESKGDNEEEEKNVENVKDESKGEEDNNYKDNFILEKYMKKKTKYYDSSLVFIKTLSLLATETGIDSRPYIIKYFVHKLCNPLNENYLYPSSVKNIVDEKIKSQFKMFIPYTRNRFNQSDNIEITNGKFQNVYSLMILNELFFHDSLNFQNGFTSFFEKKSEDSFNVSTSKRRSISIARDDKAHFLTYIAKNIILTCLLSEVSKRYRIDYISDEINSIGRNMNYTFQVAKFAIKFIQSLCEGHNREYQSYFFEAFFLNSNGNYLLCNFKKEIKFRRSKTNSVTDNNDSSFLNFLFFLMQIITNTLYPENEFQRDVFQNLKHKDYQNLLELYTSITDLIVEMLQGTYYKNFSYLYKEVSNDYSGVLRNPTDTQSPSKKHTLNDGSPSTKNLQEVQKRMYFQFIVNAVKTSEMIIMNSSHFPFASIKNGDNALSSVSTLYKFHFKKELFNPLSYEMKLRQFLIINTVISQDKIPKNIIVQLNAIFPAESLIEVISMLMCKIYEDHIKENPSESLNNSKLYELKRSFEKNLDIYNDDYFQLASQMYLFLTIMAEKYNMKEPQIVINQKNESVTEIDEIANKQIIMNEDGYELMDDNSLNENVDTDVNIQEEKIAKIKTKNNIIITCKFFSDIIKKVEFKILQDDNTLNLKTIYFIIDPAYYEISPNSIKKFENGVDRSTGTTKIRALIDNLEIFLAEVEQAEKNHKGIKMNFQDCILYNFICSCFVNMMLLFFLSDSGGASQIFLKVFTYFIQIAQVAVNIFLVFVFLFTKYDFFTEMEKKKYDKKKLTLWNMVHIYIIDSFISNDEIYLINFLIITGILGLFTKYNLFFFVVQMLTVVNFVDTIQEIIKAFYIRIDQLFCMIGFLAILIFFYANVGFYFYVDQFDTVINGQTENFCQSLLECAITYFNHGVRAGGGIGDVLGEQGFDNMSAYYLRLITDMVFYITVILLLLNMINGVIVSTFSQIREMSQQKEDDINNKCFICNIERKIFEKKKKDFLKHQEEEHNLTHYIMFFIYVLRISEKDLDADQTFIVDCLNNKDNRCFPLKMTRSIGVVEDEGEEEED